jgi:hypothetical protein
MVDPLDSVRLLEYAPMSASVCRSWLQPSLPRVWLTGHARESPFTMAETSADVRDEALRRLHWPAAPIQPKPLSGITSGSGRAAPTRNPGTQTTGRSRIPVADSGIALSNRHFEAAQRVLQAGHQAGASVEYQPGWSRSLFRLADWRAPHGTTDIVREHLDRFAGAQSALLKRPRGPRRRRFKEKKSATAPIDELLDDSGVREANANAVNNGGRFAEGLSRVHLRTFDIPLNPRVLYVVAVQRQLRDTCRTG